MMEERRAAASRPPRLGCGAAVVFIVLILALLAAFFFYRAEQWPVRAAKQVRQAFAEIGQIQPRVTIRDRVVFEQTASTLELAVATRETQVERETEHAWLGSTKRIKLRGVYRVRAGFDLTKAFNVRIEGSRVIAEIPPPKVLGADQVDVEVRSFQHGIWNKIHPEELEAELRTLPQMARLKAAEHGLQQEALESFTRQLREKLGPDVQVEVRVMETLEPLPSRSE